MPWTFLIEMLLKGPLPFINALTKLASSNFQCIEEEGYWTDGLLPKAFQVIFTCVCACRACIHIYTHRIDNVLAPQLSESGLWAGPVNFSCELGKNMELSLLKMHILYLTVLFRIFRSAEYYSYSTHGYMWVWLYVPIYMHVCVHMSTWSSEINIAYLNCFSSTLF